MNSPFIIVEIGQAHEGSLGMAHAYIDAIAQTGANAIKFQTHIAEAESSVHEPFRIQFSKQDKTRFDYWKRMEFTLSQWKELKQHCDEVQLEFMSSPFSNAAVDLLEEVGVSRYKIGSGEVTNLLILEKIAQTRKPVILSSGMSSFKELDRAVTFFKDRDIDLSVMQCTTAYPTHPEQFGLNVIQELKNRYEINVGFSDHSAKMETCIAAAALGAEIFEVHAIFNRNMFGPDASSSLEISEITQLVTALNTIKIAFDHPIDKDNTAPYHDVKHMFEKSLAVNKDLKKGHSLSFEDLEAKKPSNMGIAASKYQTLIGKKLKRDLQKWGFINQSDIE